MQQVLKQHLHRAHHVMKVQADKKRSAKEFQVGDAIFVKMRPYV